MLDKPMPSGSSKDINGGVFEKIKHDSAHLHVTGEARYTDDLPESRNLLHGYVAQSTQARAKILSMNLDAVRMAPGVVCVISAEDLGGSNDVGAVISDEPLFAEGEVGCHGQSLFAVAATSRKAAIIAARLAKIEYEILDPVITIDQARRAQDMKIEGRQTMRLGDARANIKAAPIQISGNLSLGGQDHFYLEGHISMAVPGEDGDITIFASTQNPTEMQHLVARLLGISDSKVTVDVRRMGGAFGGKETQSTLFAGMAALCSVKTGRAVKFRVDRDDDMIMTGKRHDFEINYLAGFDEKGLILGAKFDLAARCGISTDLSMAISDRAMFHSDNCYFLTAAEINSERYRTNTVSNTAFRGFGGPQGMVAIERLMDEVAFKIGRDPVDVRLDNFYAGEGRDITPYHQRVHDSVIREIVEELVDSSNYRARRQEIEAENKTNSIIKRGIALTPVKFGISFTTKHLNQAGAFINIFTDGSVQLNHGGTEMGQGLMVKVAQVVAEEFQIDIDQIKIMATSTEKVPNTSATAASCGSDLNGMAAKKAARKIKKRLVKFLSKRENVDAADIKFENSEIYVGNAVYAFKDVIKDAYLARISLSATGFYKTPKIHYDRAKHRGRPFYYYSYGAAVSEVEIDTLTGENRVTRVDILHEVGKSLNPAIDLGQIEGGFIQGMGWLTTEELVFDDIGRLQTHAPSTYKIPACGDRPDVFNVEIWQKGLNEERTIYRSKAVGEPPFMLAISVLSAISHAVSGATQHKIFGHINAPATPERILFAVNDALAKLGEE